MKKSLLSYGCFVSLALIVSGCGGGGGGSKNPPPSSVGQSSISSTQVSSSVNSVQVSSSVSSSSPVATSVQLVIQGKAAADALAGGEITFTIGSGIYKAEIDNSLQYKISLDIPNAEIEKPITVIAAGKGADEWVKLAAFLPSLKMLAGKAGSDKVLNVDEYFGVNVTALTTAEYAEIINNNLPMNTDDEYKSAFLSLHPIRAMEQAAMLTRLLTDIEIDLPSKTQSTLSYLLDANLAETHLEILRVNDESAINTYVNNIRQDASHVNVSAIRFSGNYSIEALYSNYLITFNDDGTGLLETGSMATNVPVVDSTSKVRESFTWVRKSKNIKITFSNPISFKTYYVIDESGHSIFCQNHSTWQNDHCDVRFDSIQLDLISESNDRYIANLNIAVDASSYSEKISVYKGNIKPQLARIINLSSVAPAQPVDLFGAEWVSNSHIYTFYSDGQVKKKSLYNQQESTVNWTLEKNHLVIEDVDIWITHRAIAGLGIVVADPNNIGRQLLVKRTPVLMSEADWVGRWNTYPQNMFSAAYDANKDGTFRDGFEGQTEGSWSVLNDHTQIAIANASWRMVRDVVAVHDGKYYINNCQGIETDEFVPYSCQIVVQEKSADYSSAIFWRNWSNPAFNEITTNQPLISMYGLMFTRPVGSSNFLLKRHYSVSVNKLYDYTDNLILELTSATQNEIELCEYPVNEVCNENNKRRYTRGLEIKLSVGTGGSVNQEILANEVGLGFITYLRPIDKLFMLPKGLSQKLVINPNTGHSLDVITGCNGSLIGNEYTIPSLTEACELSISFKKL